MNTKTAKAVDPEIPTKPAAKQSTLKPVPSRSEEESKAREIEARIKAAPKPINFKQQMENFKDGWSKTPNRIFSSELPPRAKILYAVLKGASDNNNPDREIFASGSELANETKLAERTIDAAIQDLVKAGLIGKTPGYSGVDKNGVRRADPQSNSFKIIPLTDQKI